MTQVIKMDRTNKNSLSYKVQKNPFILGLFIIVLAIALVVIFSLSSAIKDKKEELESVNATTTTEQSIQQEETTQPQFKIELNNVKKRVDGVKSITADYDNNCAKITAEFINKNSLLDAHYAENDFTLNSYPVFCFYINNGTQVKCPGTLKLSEDGTTVVYYLYNIDDLANAVALTDEITVNYQNVFNLKFNVYLQHKTNEGVGRTVIGTYGNTVEDFEAKYAQTPVMVSSKAQGVSRLECVKTEEFIWLDIYFENEKSYKELNHNFENNFLCFGFEKGGKKFEWKFITTEYDGLNMIRCKLDSYSMTLLQKEVSDTSLTIPTLFTDYTISVWSSDYDTQTQLVTF